MLTPVIKLKIVLLLLLSFGLTKVKAQAKLDTYIREALESNLVLKERKLGLQRGILGLQSAKRLFLPSVNFSGSYTLAAGGRSIDFPIGDLMNPVYSTLNMLTQSNSFPQVENQSIQFLPNNFYDAKLRTTMPLLNSDLIHNKRIQESAIEMKQIEVDVYRLELVRDVRLAYYRYEMAENAVSIYKSAAVLVAQNLRLNKSLLENGKGLPAQVLRAESEMEQINAQITIAESQLQNARAYFNFLLNKNSDTPIETEQIELPEDLENQLLDEGQIAQRPELAQLDMALKMNAEATLMDKQYWLPRLGAFVDLGSQGFNFDFNNKTMYTMAGIQVEIPLWNGGRDQTDIALRAQSQKEIENKRAQAEQGFMLSIFAQRNATLAAYSAWKSSLRQVEAAEAYQRLVEKGAAQGSFSLIEQIDARNNLTQAQLLSNIRKFETFINWAQYKRETAQIFE